MVRCPRFPKKIQYVQRDQAIIAMKRMKNKQLSTYRCGGCQQWHIGNSRKPWKVQARITQLLQR